MKKKIKIICTLGPSSLNSKFLEYSRKNVDLLRLNMSHLGISELNKNILYIKKKTNCPICIDTEGAQIRSKFTKRKFLKKNSFIYICKDKNKNLGLYPEYIQDKLKLNDTLNIGFEGLKVRITKKKGEFLLAKVINQGYLESNKGIHLENRSIKLKCLTEKDIEAIKIGKLNNINNFALSFTNSLNDVKYFNQLTSNNSNNIFKIETKQSINEFKEIINEGNNFLIDRGDLSKDISVYKIPETQRKLINIKNQYKNKKIFIATNLLESMILNEYPTRAEANDIYSCIEMGADGLVLAAETAVGKNPIECIKFIKEMIDQFK
jgi:pyruvate kinase|tara:strand:- start:751 stop:1713 length:963 start_codon:yes stop_codon:yes gene_type:complete